MALHDRLFDLLQSRVARRRPSDQNIGPRDNIYLRRWYVIPRNPLFNIYLHQFLRSDDDRALHDHPWLNVSYVLRGSYYEQTIAAGGVHSRTLRSAGMFAFRRARQAHRVELLREGKERFVSTMKTRADGTQFVSAVVRANEIACWTLFITGPRIRAWGFHCPAGWVHWKKFTKPGAPGEVGPGCGEA